MLKNKITKRKNHQLKRSRRELKKGRNRKVKPYILIISSNNQPSYFRKQQIFAQIAFPSKLLLESEEAPNFLNWIREIKKVAAQGYFIDFKLDDVQFIGDGTIPMLLSVMSDLTAKGIHFRGNKPKNEDVRDVFERSGFFRHIIGGVSKKNMLTKNTIITTGTLKTHQKEMVPEIHKAMQTIWGVEARCPALYAGLGEMMRNSCDHAFANSNNVRWHLGISHCEEENMVKFSFVDNGTGIISSYNKRGLLTQVRSFFRNNSKFLETAYRDGIQSVTGLPWRGKGLPTIFEMYNENIITNLVVITNKVYLDFDKKIFEDMTASFSGTYYFWKMNCNCKPCFFPINHD